VRLVFVCHSEEACRRKFQLFGLAACRTYREQAHYTPRIPSNTSSLRSRLVGRSNPCVNPVRWIATSHHVPSCRDSWLKATDAPFHEQGLFYRYFSLSKSKSTSKSKSFFIPFSFEPRLRHCESRPVGMWQSIPIERIVHCSCAVLIPTCRDRKDGRKSDKVRQSAIIDGFRPDASPDRSYSRHMRRGQKRIFTRLLLHTHGQFVRFNKSKGFQNRVPVTTR
jgi:hypothetical protein